MSKQLPINSFWMDTLPETFWKRNHMFFTAVIGWKKSLIRFMQWTSMKSVVMKDEVRKKCTRTYIPKTTETMRVYVPTYTDIEFTWISIPFPPKRRSLQISAAQQGSSWWGNKKKRCQELCTSSQRWFFLLFPSGHLEFYRGDHYLQNCCYRWLKAYIF